MKQIERLIFLLDACKVITGSDRQTAQALEIPPEHIAMWKSGARNASPEDMALLAAIAGIDPHKVLADAMLDKWEGKRKGQKLKDALSDD